MRWTLALALVALLLGAAPAAAPAPAPAFRVLAFTKTAGYRHGSSIAAAIKALQDLSAQNGFAVETTEDANSFTDQNLAQYKVVAFLLTTGDVLDAEQQRAFERFIEGGGGFVGVHSAADTEYDWPWYGGLIGAWFKSHPAIQQARINVSDTTDLSTVGLPREWVRTDEWYNFRSNPRSAVHVLATIDESSYAPGADAMGTDHPIAWSHSYAGGRAWYTAGGHTDEAWSEPLFLTHVLGGVEWAAGFTPPAKAAEPALKITSLTTAVSGRRVVVTVKHPSCSCVAVLSVSVRGHAQTTRVAAKGSTTRVKSALLPPGRWQLTFTLKSRTDAKGATARRWIRVR